MILKVFSVYDVKACAYMQPFFAVNSGSALRSFDDAVMDEKSIFAKHPGDYQLFELGTFDDSVGLLTSLVPVKCLANAADFAGRKPASEVPIFEQMKELANGSKSA